MANTPLHNYFNSIRDRYKLGTATEHTYRGDLQQLLETLGGDVRITNEPRRQECGAPDYIATRKEIPLGFIEAKDIGDHLDKTEKSEQLKRYRESLDNLILTDYLEFRLFRYGEKVSVIRIAGIEDGKLLPLKGNWQAFEDLMREFYAFTGQTITNPDKLARMMAAKARMMQEVIKNALNADIETDPYQTYQETSSIQQQYKAFKDVLIHDVKPEEFADLYAQTIAYGMFAARLNDTTLEDFSRKEAAELVPKSNPFLRKLFQYIAGYDLDSRLVWIVDALADVFRATNVKELLKDFGISTQTTDPIIHFYETFLAEYNPALRKSRGVYYTPQPVVNFIVRAVDDILKEEFGLPQGLADTSKIRITTEVQGKKVEKEVHKVQILDPACGTGNFLAEVIRQVYKKFEGQQGVWNDYVEQHLIPRLNGFEILMASYAMCHLKLELLLRETGYKPYEPKRLRVFLTNSLEEAGENKRDLFTQWLTDEALQANVVKRDTPVMVVIGNPPYSGISKNMGAWITDLIEDYKYVDGVHFGEKKHWLQDDYVKFIRYGEHFIEKNGSGILAYINNHSFLDNPTFRGMRWHLLQTFDKIYIIDLHGNALKKERCPDGSKDENVFDIQQGVSINLFIRNSGKKTDKLAQVYYNEIWGDRQTKYELLMSPESYNTKMVNLDFKFPYYFFTPKNLWGKEEYDKGFSIRELFLMNVTAIVTARDDFVIDFNRQNLLNRIKEFCDLDIADEITRIKFFGPAKVGQKYPQGDSRGWKLPVARREASILDHSKQIVKISYRPFDDRFIYYHPSMVDWGREKYMQHFLKGENVGLIISRQAITNNWSHLQVTKFIADNRIHYSNKGIPIICPLYLYNEGNTQQIIEEHLKRTPNLNLGIVAIIATSLSLAFVSEEEDTNGNFSPINLLDYIYAVLHSPSYREKYKEFLKTDFPRIPYPTDKDTFWKLVALGTELRQLHLLESPKVNQFITSYPVAGVNEVSKVNYEGVDTGKVWINANQYFDNVPKIAWEFYIGGYQPAQKWLKDRKGRKLNFEDIMHYQKVIVALAETDRVMREVDMLL